MDSERGQDGTLGRAPRTDADGRFSVPAPLRKNALLVYDRDRRRGAAIVFDPKHPERPVEARLQPLIRVFGTIGLAGAESPRTLWSTTYLSMPYDENDPLNFPRMAMCGSFKGRFEFVVPPGTYEFSASGSEPLAKTVEDRRVPVTAGQKDLDLGTLVLRPILGLIRIDRAKAQGTWGNYKEHFGKQPPPWHLTDAKGIARDARLSDFRGKWVVLYFWSPDCAPCLGKQLPELMAFHDAYKAQRDGSRSSPSAAISARRSRTSRELEAATRAGQEGRLGRQELPFPMLLDNTFQTTRAVRRGRKRCHHVDRSRGQARRGGLEDARGQAPSFGCPSRGGW